MISRYIAILSLGIALASPTTHARIFITHGFNGAQGEWYQPGGDFYEALKEAALEEGHSVTHFTWNQKTSLGFLYQEQKAGGLQLAQEIINFCQNYRYNPKYPNDHEIIVVAHSYGGLVSYHASNSLELFSNHMDMEKQEKPALNKSLFRWAQEKLWPTKPIPAMPVPVISKLFTLGTPHQETDVVPSTHGVLNIYNIYSSADNVANGLFAGSPLLPNTLQKKYKNSYNILLLGQTNNEIHGFNHSQIHHPAVAKALFDLANYTRHQITHGHKNIGISRHISYAIQMPEELQIQNELTENPYQIAADILIRLMQPNGQGVVK
jgi:hypothetical protein